MKRISAWLTLVLSTFCLQLFAQQNAETEFTKGFLLSAKLHNGVVTNFKGSTPDVYAGGIGVNAQLTAIPAKLRIGANAGVFYINKKTIALFGPMAALRLKTFKAGDFGSLANLQLVAEANWGTAKQRMAGGGLAVELFDLAQIAATLQRDYHLNNWWLQTTVSIRLNKRRQVKDPYAML